MEKFKVSFSADNQQLKALGTKHASDTYADIEATFVLGNRWTDMDSVSAVWWNDFTKVATVLDSQGKCIVPHEVLTRKGCVRVNLVGSIVEGDELVTRLTSYSAEAVQVNEKIKLTGNETSEITPSQYEQFVANVKADADRAEAGADEAEASAQSASESATASADSATSSAQSATASAQSAQNASESAQSAENAKDDAEDARDEILGMRATAETLEAGSDATASYSDGLLTLGIPRGDKGEQGIQGETGATPNFSIGEVDTLEPNESATATITGTAENPVLNLGIPKGEQGDVNLSQLEALLPTETASGEIVTITDGQSVVPAKSLKVTLEPIQEGSGTPSPDNIRPISGHTEVNTQRTGKNLLPNDSGSYSLSNAYRYITRIMPDGVRAWMSFTDKDTSVNVSDISIGFVHGYSGGSASLFRWCLNNGTIADHSNVATSGTSILCEGIFIYPKTEDAFNRLFARYNIMVELGSTATAYEPYQGTTYTTTLGRTVYGGTLDVVSGELTVTHAMVDMGTLNWEQSGATFLARSGIDSAVRTASQIGSGFICSNYPPSTNWNLDQDGTMAIFTTQVRVNDTRYTDVASFTSAMSGVQLCYELATPQIIQLTPQEVELLTGTNNVWSDGNVTLVYNADIQRYIEKKLNENSTNSMLTMSRPMTAERTDAESESVDTNSVDTAQVGDDL